MQDASKKKKKKSEVMQRDIRTPSLLKVGRNSELSTSTNVAGL